MNYHNELLDSGQSAEECPPSKIFSVRVLVAFLSLLGTAIMYVTRVNLNIAILAMVPSEIPQAEVFLFSDVPANDSSSWTTIAPNQTVNQSYEISNQVFPRQTAEFSWSPPEQGIILGNYLVNVSCLK